MALAPLLSRNIGSRAISNILRLTAQIGGGIAPFNAITAFRYACAKKGAKLSGADNGQLARTLCINFMIWLVLPGMGGLVEQRSGRTACKYHRRECRTPNLLGRSDALSWRLGCSCPNKAIRNHDVPAPQLTPMICSPRPLLLHEPTLKAAPWTSSMLSVRNCTTPALSMRGSSSP
jgi:hypothetical protein